jgi:hypothetical protein
MTAFMRVEEPESTPIAGPERVHFDKMTLAVW